MAWLAFRLFKGETVTEAWKVAETELRRNVEGNALGHRRDLAHLLLERGAPDDVEEAVALMKTEAAQRRDAETLNLLAWALWKQASCLRHSRPSVRP
jgi:hypothetical protein